MRSKDGIISDHALVAAIEQAADCIVITDLAGIIEYVNPAYTAMTGYSSDEALGRSTRIHKSGVHSNELYRDLWTTICAGLQWAGQLTNRRKDGTLYQEEMQITPVKGPDGKIERFIAIKKDVTGRQQAEEAVRSSLEFAQSTIDALQSHICVLDERGTILAVNRSWREFARSNSVEGSERAGDEESLGVGASYLSVCNRVTGAEADAVAAFAEGIRTVIGGERESYSAEYPCDSPSERRWFLGRVTRFRSGQPPRVLVEHIDITQRRLMEESLLIETALLEGQTESSPDGMLAVDDASRIVLANRQFARLFGIPKEMLLVGDNRAVLSFVAEMVLEKEAFLERIRYLYAHREEKGNDEIRLKNGRVVDRYSTPLIDSDGKYRGRIWYFRDITDRKAAEARIQFLAYHDALTGLPHRSWLEDRLNGAVEVAQSRCEQIALLYVDLDRFKSINDTFGHAFGDALLKQVGDRLRSVAHEQDTVARLGSDEFLMMLNGGSEPADAKLAADRILEAMAHRFTVRGQSIGIGCSIGISLFPEHGSNGEMLIKNANTAVHCAKDRGRGAVQFFTTHMDAQAKWQLMLERNLGLALKRNEFFLVYQPQVELRSGKIMGLEVLIRWRHPELGLVSPEKFIPVAENSGLILPIGDWVLRTACAQALAWQQEGLPTVPISVNVSAVQFRQESFLPSIQRMLLETGLPARFLELELTESLLLSDVEATGAVIRELQEMEVKLAIDDFGTGYSSFNYLKQFRFGKLKIDRSFLRDLESSPDDGAITAAIISMAKSLKVTLVAEGVENEAQLAFLRDHGCDAAQGFLLNRPMPADEIPEVLLQANGRKPVADLPHRVGRQVHRAAKPV